MMPDDNLPIGDDGELQIDAELLEHRKSKKKYPLIPRRAYVSTRLLFLLMVLLLALTVLLFVNPNLIASSLCFIPGRCYVPQPYVPPQAHAPAGLMREDGELHFSTMNQRGETISYAQTITPAPYAPYPACAGAEQATGILITAGGSRNSELFIIHPTDDSVCRLTFDDIGMYWFDWSPDGQRIAFIGERDDQRGSDLFVMNLDGTDLVNLTNNPANEASPSWSPDGNRIAFATEFDDGQNDLAIIHADGSGFLRLAANLVSERDAAWSPDGNRIAFVASDTGYSPQEVDIFIIDIDGANRQRVTQNNAYDGRPAWSPDSRALVYCSGSRLEDGLYITPDLFIQDVFDVQVNEGVTRLNSDYRRNECSGNWSPDGKQIAYIQSDSVEDSSNVFIMEVETRTIRRLTFNLPVVNIGGWR
ncbi:MAG: PD40 domain-containing protein [Chloroflexi bacterium]|uniref:TolB family protein n=1 Tax=Candidatus Flexifilum breve TaxID=3140694 RepID=UPI003135B78D|nr:PD40 domain-containing protein [Chloroflexota bacterium]